MGECELLRLCTRTTSRSTAGSDTLNHIVWGSASSNASSSAGTVHEDRQVVVHTEQPHHIVATAKAAPMKGSCRQSEADSANALAPK